MITVLVCGGRDYRDEQRVNEVLNKIQRTSVICWLIQGGARGADTLAYTWGLRNHVRLRTFPADWATFGKAAGFIRNKAMLDEGKPDLVVAFPGGPGTRNMVELARAAGVYVIEVDK
jgi:hypothetical protein